MRNLFVLIRKDLKSSGYQAVQAGHAVAAHMLNASSQWRNDYLYYLTVENEVELLEWAERLELRDFCFSTFREPDMNNQMTALAVEADSDKMFKQLSLLNDDKKIDECIDTVKSMIRMNCENHTPYRGPCVDCGRIDNFEVLQSPDDVVEALIQMKGSS